ncbi:MAG: HAMP domain-containing sensor histidine kinase [Lapillicoccus sp.]
MTRRRTRHREDARLHALTWQIGLWAAALVIGCVLVTAGALLATYLHQTDSETDALLASAATQITDPATAPLGTYLTIEEGGSLRTSPGMPAGLPDRAALAQVRQHGGTVQQAADGDPSSQSYIIRTSRVGDRVVQVVLDQTRVDEARERLVRSIVIAGGLGMLMAAGAATLLTRRVVRPLASTIQMQRQFVADASHELRTPLTLLSTRAQLLRRRLRREDPGPAVQEADALVADVSSLTEILDDLLLAAALPEARAPEVVDLDALVGAVLAAATPHAATLGIDLSRSGDTFTDALPAAVSGHPFALRRAVTALVDNALEHAHTDVVLSLSVEGRDLVVRVADDGPGVPEDKAARIFDRFHRASGDLEDHPGRRHYGLGLALVADVVAAHGGTVSVVTRGVGAQGGLLQLTLPRATDRSG